MSHEVRVARTRYELAELLAPVRARGERVGLVPTMGALHVGHTSLIDRARTEAATETGPGAVVVSIFVNPMQFAAGEDLDRYPRTFAEDLELCAAHGADVIFAPAVEEMYPHGVPDPERPTGVTVDPGPLAAVLEGASRPTHFRGVLTVVAKLFGLVAPDLAVFGEKDYQQLVLIRRMAADLCQGVEVIGAPTVREPDGLALSSRNRYLDPDERTRGTALVRTLTAAVEEARYGLPAVLDAARGQLRASRGVDLDYLVVADAETLADLEKQPQPLPAGTSARILIAARVGSTRLIDNLPLTF